MRSAFKSILTEIRAARGARQSRDLSPIAELVDRFAELVDRFPERLQVRPAEPVPRMLGEREQATNGGHGWCAASLGHDGRHSVQPRIESGAQVLRPAAQNDRCVYRRLL